MLKNKVLIIRFSSFGDIIQCSSIVEEIASNKEISFEIHWATKSEFSDIVAINQNVKKIFSLNKKLGFFGLIAFAKQLRLEKYDYVYDAHNNMRSLFIKCYLSFFIFSKPKFIVRSKNRWKRILLFNFRIDTFPLPFKGRNSFINPLKKEKFFNFLNLDTKPDWKFEEKTETKIKNLIQNEKRITLVPSAAWEMKKWPKENFEKLINILPDFHFYILGGPGDITLSEDICKNKLNVTNLAGKLSLVESCCFIKHSKIVISADTGLLHVADMLNINSVGIIGPTAFGHTTSKNVKILEADLKCMPCSKDGRGKCSQDVWQKCMLQITSDQVAREISQFTF